MGIPATPPVVPTPPAGDKANLVWSSESAGQAPFTGTAETGWVEIFGPFNLVIYAAPDSDDDDANTAWVGTVRLERSFDGGATPIVCGVGGGGQQASWSTGTDLSFIIGECEKGVLYRLVCTAWTSGTIRWRFSTTGAAAMSLSVASVIG